FITSDRVANFVELSGGGEAGRAGADDGDAFAGARWRRLRHNPAFGKAAVDDRVLDVLDGHRRIGNAEHACAFARRGTGATGELWKIVGFVQSIEGVAPAALIDKVVPLRNKVVD